MSKKKENSFLMQGTILAAAAMITKVIGLAYRIPVTNIMGEDGNGFYGIAFQVYNLALMLTSYSLPMAVSKLVSARVATGQYRNANKVFRIAMTMAVVTGAMMSLIVFFGAGFIAEDIMKMELSAYALRVLAPCILIVAILGVLRGFFQGFGTMVPTAISQVIEQILNAIVSILGAYLLLNMGKEMASGADKETYGAAYAAAGATAGTVAGALIALVFLILLFAAFYKHFKRRMKRDRRHRPESSAYIFRILLFTIAPVILSSTVYNISNLLDQTMFTNIMAAQGVPEKTYRGLLGVFTGQYDTITNIPLSVSSALAASFMPSLVATIQTKNRKQIHKKIEVVSRFNMIIAIPCAAAFMTLAKPLLDLLFYTQDNTVPAYLLQIGGISVVFFCLSTVTNAALQGMDRMMKPVKNAAISLLIHLAALYIMLVAFKWSIYSIVASKIIFAAAICFLNARDLRETCGYVQEYRKTFVFPVISAVIMSGAALLTHLLFELFIGEQIATVIAVIVAIPVYFITLILLGGITEAELLTIPKGKQIVSLLYKLKLFRAKR